MPVRPVQSRAVLVERGFAPAYFAQWWGGANRAKGLPLGPGCSIEFGPEMAADRFYLRLGTSMWRLDPPEVR